jgi:hypothetical protein
VVLGEDRRVLADGPTAAILADRDLLIRANLIHEHLHEHGGMRHAHEHDAEHHGADEPVAASEDPAHEHGGEPGRVGREDDGDGGDGHPHPSAAAGEGAHVAPAQAIADDPEAFE